MACVGLLAGCGGKEAEPAPRLAIPAPKGVQGGIGSPGVKAAFAIQGALDAGAAQATMASYLGNRFAGSWIVNNGKRGILYIGVVHPTADDQRYADRTIEMGPHASFRLVAERYSMNQLAAFDSKVSHYVASHAKTKAVQEHPFSSIGISEVNNAVEFGLPRADAAFWIPQIQPLLPYEALVIQYGGPASTN
jgi:hypothetical protein